MSSPDHLVIVCGHGIWLGGPKNGWDESEWLIESYKSGETPTFIEHIKAGVRILGEDPNTILVFSGGPTRQETAISEAASYANLAASNGYFGLLPPGQQDPVTASRILLEDRALDSYYNVLFSLVLFWRARGTWPRRLTLVSHAFKRARLVDAHCAALGFPSSRVNFVGINPPGIAENPQGGDSSVGFGDQVSQDKMEVMSRGVQQVVDEWAADPHGVGPALAGKRAQRNPWGVSQRLFASEQERAQSGVETTTLQDGTEALAEGFRAPWAVDSA